MSKVIPLKPNSLTVRKKDYTPEAWKRICSWKESKEKALLHFSALYGQDVAPIIVANASAEYTMIYKKSPRTFDECWNALGFQYTSEIVFRAINHLPCKRKDTGEMANFLKERKN